MGRITTEGCLRPRMSLEAVPQAIGSAAVFEIDAIVMDELAGKNAPRSGTVTGATLTTPPLRWSIRAKAHLDGYVPGDIVTPGTLLQPSFITDSFRLGEPILEIPAPVVIKPPSELAHTQA